MAGHRKAVLVMPNVGLSEEKLRSLTHEFQNHIVGTLKNAGASRLREGEPITVELQYVDSEV